MTEQRKDAINKMADLILDSFHVNTPISYEKFEEIICKFGGALEPSSEFDELTYGRITPKTDNSFTIYYKNSESDEEKRFTIAHELGHFFLHIHEPDGKIKKEYCDSPLYRRGFSTEETEANEFASALLMPKTVFLDYVLKNKKDGYINIDDVAKHFSVSRSAAFERGKSLGYFA